MGEKVLLSSAVIAADMMVRCPMSYPSDESFGFDDDQISLFTVRVHDVQTSSQLTVESNQLSVGPPINVRLL